MKFRGSGDGILVPGGFGSRVAEELSSLEPDPFPGVRIRGVSDHRPNGPGVPPPRVLERVKRSELPCI
jgi:hypothetical protein